MSPLIMLLQYIVRDRVSLRVSYTSIMLICNDYLGNLLPFQVKIFLQRVHDTGDLMDIKISVGTNELASLL